MAPVRKSVQFAPVLSLSQIMRQELQNGDLNTQQMRNIVVNKYGYRDFNEGTFNVTLSVIRKQLGYASRFAKRVNAQKISVEVVKVAKTLTKKFGDKKQLLKVVKTLDNATKTVGLSNLRVFLENLDS